MVSTRPFISKSSSPFINSLVTVPRAPIITGINVSFMFHNFFSSLVRSTYISFYSHSFNFIQWSAGTTKSTILKVLFFCWLLLGPVVWPKLSDPFVYQNHRGVCACHSADWCWVVHIPFIRMVKLKCLAQFPGDHFTHPVVSSLILFLG